MKKLIVIIFIMFGAFLTFSLYRTFAYDTSIVEETPSTTDLEYTFKIGNSSIKQITVDSGETKYYDVVLGNPNPAKISYGVYYEMVSPSSKPDGFSIEYTSKSTGESTGKIDKESTITLNLIVTNTSSSSVTVKLGTVAGYVNGGELTLESGQEYIPKRLTGAEYVMSLDDGTTGDSGSGVYKVHHDAIPSGSSATGSEIKASTDYRYYGANPNNYVCLDMEGNDTCPDKHLYRIIGSIYEEKENTNRIKVIKATPLTDGTTSTFSWDYKSDGSYSNIWATVTSGNYSNSLTSGSQLMKLLNSGAWWNGTIGSYYNYSATSAPPALPPGFAETPTEINFTNYKLSDKAKGFMGESRYYLGGNNEFGVTPNVYVAERGQDRYGANPLYWDGMVGLMYPSDYGYTAGNTCANDMVLYGYRSNECGDKTFVFSNATQWHWTIMPGITSSTAAWSCSVSYGLYTSSAGRVSPVFYLKSNVVITSGTGTEQDPYLVQ